MVCESWNEYSGAAVGNQDGINRGLQDGLIFEDTSCKCEHKN